MNRIKSVVVACFISAAGVAHATESSPLVQAGADYAEGLRYATGGGVQQDYVRAFQLYRRAAEQGHVLSQYNVGLYYDMGYGVNRNPSEAIRWYQKASQAGNRNAGMRMQSLIQPAAYARAQSPFASAAPGAMPASASYMPAPVAGGAPASAPAAGTAAVSYQRAVASQDYAAAARALEQARAQGQLAALGLSDLDTTQEQARLALLSNDRALAQAYLEQAAARGAPQAQAALNQLAQGGNLATLGASYSTPQVAAALDQAAARYGVVLESGVSQDLVNQAAARYGDKLTGNVGGGIAQALSGDVSGASRGVAANYAAEAAQRYGANVPGGLGDVAGALTSGNAVAATTEVAKQKAKDAAVQALGEKIPGAAGIFSSLFGGKK